MPDHDLPAALAALRPPAPDEAARARALFRATLAHSAAAHAGRAAASESAAAALPAPRPRPGAGRRFSLAFALPALALVLLAPLFRPASAPRAAADSAPAAAELLAQLEQLFPGQLNAVVDRDGVLQLDLATHASPASPADQALLVELIRDDRRLRILAYSGRPVRLRLDGADLGFDPLLTSDGGVVLSGNDFAWSSSAPRLLAGWHVAARPLAPVL